jgi:hypothetical protein
VTILLNRPPKARPGGALIKSCCNPRPWEPLCVDCPRRFTSNRLASLDSKGES